jgi:hypothetical protein
MREQPVHDCPTQMSGAVVPDQNQPQRRQGIARFVSQPCCPLGHQRSPRFPHRHSGQRRKNLGQFRLHPRMQDSMRATPHPVAPYLARGGAEECQQFRGADAHLFVRLSQRITFRLPTCPRIGNRLVRPRLILAPQGNARWFRPPIGPLDQPLFSSVAGSPTVTTPLLPTRCAVPVGHQVRGR